MSDETVVHNERCPIVYGAPLEKCTCEALAAPETHDPMSSAVKLAIAGFIMFTIGLAWWLGLDIALAVDGALLMAAAVMMMRGGSDATDS